MTRHLRLVAQGGNFVEPQPPQPQPRPAVTLDAALVDHLIDVLDLLLLATRPAAADPGTEGVSTPWTPEPSQPTNPTKPEGAQPS